MNLKKRMRSSREKRLNVNEFWHILGIKDSPFENLVRCGSIIDLLGNSVQVLFEFVKVLLCARVYNVGSQMNMVEIIGFCDKVGFVLKSNTNKKI